jgi:DNA-directed RNA polymerase specialized sigma24 family protein
MSSDGSVTHWIAQLKAGDAQAAQPLWERYYRRLVGLAGKKLQGSPRRGADEEDAASSAFASFCRGAEQGKFPKLHDRHDLWHLLVVITAHKSIDQYHQEAHAGLGESALLNPADKSDAALAQIIGSEPTPEFAAGVAEQVQRLLACLNPELRSVAVWKMEGYTNEEIAAKLGVVVRSVERKLRLIRKTWETLLEK